MTVWWSGAIKMRKPCYALATKRTTWRWPIHQTCFCLCRIARLLTNCQAARTALSWCKHRYWTITAASDPTPMVPSKLVQRCTVGISTLFQIWGFCSSYWELRKQRPRMKKLKQLLMENPYEGPSLRGQEDPESLVSLVWFISSVVYWVGTKRSRVRIHIHGPPLPSNWF